MNLAKNELPSIRVLILHGTKDKATKPSGSQFFYDTVKSKNKILKLYKGVCHDLLNDKNKEDVMANIRNRMNKRFPAA